MLDYHLTAEATKDHLIAARMATLLHEAKSSNANAFRNEILPTLYQSKVEAESAEGRRSRRPHEKELETHRQTLDAILADLILASAHVEALGYCYRSSNRQEFTTSETKASSRVYDWQIDALDATGLIRRLTGFSANDDFGGVAYVDYRRATRLRATPVLLAIARRHGISSKNLYDHYVKLKHSKRASPIVLRAERHRGTRGKALRCPDTAQTVELRRQVERINAVYDRHNFENMPEPQVYRLFNCADSDRFDYNKGGRLHGDFQSMARERRQKILIDGQPVVELDLKASQLTILYGITNTPRPEGDLYHVDGLPRSVVKAIITSMIGLGHTNMIRWPSEQRRSLLDHLGEGQPMDPKRFGKLYPLKATVGKVLKTHPVLHHLSPGKLDWADLQFIESEVLISAILQLGEEYDIPALPIHDSIIVPEKDKDIGHMILSRAFSTVVGRAPVIEMKA